MARNHRSRHQAGANDFGRTDLSALAPDVLLGIWSTWMKSGSDMAQQWMSPVRPWWQLPHVTRAMERTLPIRRRRVGRLLQRPRTARAP